ncbi:hypothetical protein GY26_20020 [Gammaproteobacteria bacterium MFB021]|nr:hypothetical protein GY26_20020 [Gammaproteobacteria bacterium MFB021]
MAPWFDHLQEAAALCLGLYALLLLCRGNALPPAAVPAALMLAVAIKSPLLTPTVALSLSLVLLLAASVTLRPGLMPAWLASSLPSTGSGAEAAVQVTAHPVRGTLQVFYLSRWFEAILIDPANPPLREGETVYLIRHGSRQAWVSRVRSHTPPDTPSRRWNWRTQ